MWCNCELDTQQLSRVSELILSNVAAKTLQACTAVPSTISLVKFQEISHREHLRWAIKQNTHGVLASSHSNRMLIEPWFLLWIELYCKTPLSRIYYCSWPVPLCQYAAACQLIRGLHTCSQNSHSTEGNKCWALSINSEGVSPERPSALHWLQPRRTGSWVVELIFR